MQSINITKTLKVVPIASTLVAITMPTLGKEINSFKSTPLRNRPLYIKQYNQHKCTVLDTPCTVYCA